MVTRLRNHGELLLNGSALPRVPVSYLDGTEHGAWTLDGIRVLVKPPGGTLGPDDDVVIVERPGIFRRAWRLWSGPGARGPTSLLASDGGFCFRTALPVPAWRRPRERGDHYLIFEDDTPLLGPAASHDDIRRLGQGRYSVWDDTVYLSSTDNSDPRWNGRTYRLLRASRLHRWVLGAMRPARGRWRLDVDRPAEQPFMDTLATFGERRPGSGDGGPLRAVDVVTSSLSAGGAERQACLLAVGLAERGLLVRLLTLEEPVGEAGHYVDMLRDSSVLVQSASSVDDEPPVESVATAEALQLLAGAPPYLQPHVAHLFTRFVERRPDGVVCLLDRPNIVGGIAALAAGVRRVVLSFRNVNPTHFPQIFQPWMLPLYRWLVAQEGVALTANCTAGAADYAAWLGLPPEAVQVVPNGLHPSWFGGVESEALPRSSERPTIVWVGRLSPEKDPERLVDVVAGLVASVPDLQVLVLGVGPCEAAMRARAERRGVVHHLRWLGRRRDVAAVLARADIVLSTSRFEGMPNALMEAQAGGRPVVAPAVGGVAEVVEHGVTGLVVPPGDVDALTRACADLLRDQVRRRTMGAAARQRAAERFGIDRTVDGTLDALYGRSGHAGRHSR